MKYQALRLLAAILTVGLSGTAIAAPVQVSACYVKAGRDYGIDPDLLLAIGIKESHLNNNAINNKSFDYCQMQVNQTHTKELRDFGLNLKDLTNKPCACIYSGGWVLAKFFQRYGKSWNTVGMYNAGSKNTPAAARNREIYARSVKAIYTVLKMQKAQGDKETIARLGDTAKQNK